MAGDLVPVSRGMVAVVASEAPPAIVLEAGGAACFAWDEFFDGEIRNPHTRAAYRRNIRRFLAWCEGQGANLGRITPGMVGKYLDQLAGSPATKKQHLAAIRKLFDTLVIRHAVVLNPAASVRGERHQIIEGKTPEIPIEQARTLLGRIRTRIGPEPKDDALDTRPPQLIGLRDRAAIGILIYTAARVGAVAKLRLKDFEHDGSQWSLRFDEKGGKSREIPVRHDLERFILDYLDAAGIRQEARDSPLFRTTERRTKRLTVNAMTAVDLCRMVKRRLKDAGLPARLSPHSFRVMTITDLLTQGVPLEDVQYLAGHADARTTRLYDRRQKKVTRNIVERISV